MEKQKMFQTTNQIFMENLEFNLPQRWPPEFNLRVGKLTFAGLGIGLMGKAIAGNRS